MCHIKMAAEYGNFHTWSLDRFTVSADITTVSEFKFVHEGLIDWLNFNYVWLIDWLNFDYASIKV